MNLSSDYYGQSCLLTLLVLRQGREKLGEKGGRRGGGERKKRERKRERKIERKIERKGVGGKEKEDIG